METIKRFFAGEATAGLRGWIDNSNDSYHKGPGVGSTTLKDYIESPGLFYHRHILGNPRKETDALNIGRIVHLAVLQPQEFLNTYKIAPDFGDLRSSTNRANKAAWFADQPPGTVIVTEAERSMLIAMAESITDHPYAYELLKCGTPERSGYWLDNDTGLLLKCRPDFYRADANMCVDLKTCRSTKYRVFQKDAMSWGYHISAAQYLEGINNIDNKKCEDFILIALEKTEPYNCEVFIIDQEMMDVGRKMFRNGINELATNLMNHVKLVSVGGATDRDKRSVWPKNVNRNKDLSPMNLSLPEYALYE